MELFWSVQTHTLAPFKESHATRGLGHLDPAKRGNPVGEYPVKEVLGHDLGRRIRIV